MSLMRSISKIKHSNVKDLDVSFVFKERFSVKLSMLVFGGSRITGKPGEKSSKQRRQPTMDAGKFFPSPLTKSKIDYLCPFLLLKTRHFPAFIREDGRYVIQLQRS